MAKRKQTTEVVANKQDAIKKLNQTGKKGNAAAKTPKIKAKESKPRNTVPRNRELKKATEHSGRKKSKYFSKPVKEESDGMSECSEDVNMSLPESSELKSKAIKEEKKKTVKADDESEDSDEEWEEVEELEALAGPVEAKTEPAVPSEPVEIEIETVEAMYKRKKREQKEEEIETYLRRAMKRFSKQILEDTHKVHLLCLLASGLFRNRICCEPDLLAITLSVVPSNLTKVIAKRVNTVYLESLLKWFKETFTLNPELPEEKNIDLRVLLEKRLASLSARDHQEMTFLFLLVLRSLRRVCRLVLSLHPLSFKPSANQDYAQTSSSPPGKDMMKLEKPPEPKVSPGSKRPPAVSTEEQQKSGAKRQKKNFDGGAENKKKEAVGVQRPKNTKRRSVAAKVSYKEYSSGEEDELSDGDEYRPGNLDESNDESDVESDVENDSSDGNVNVLNRNSKAKTKGKFQAPQKSSGSKKHTKKMEKDEDGVKLEQKRKPVKRRPSNVSVRKGNDEWIEVYLEGMKKWMCVDVDQGVVPPELCTNKATRPITYIVGVDGDGYLKDLSRRYDPTWLTTSRSRRIDSEWWEETMSFYESPDSERKKQEDKELQEKLMDKPLPTSIAEYKNHTLYALERHLLKYQALYPPTAAILGYCRGEAVYSRDCVHTLHSRDTWLKKARTVRLGEEPYKMVKGFSNQSRKSRRMSEDKDVKDLPLFGLWQTEEYEPPVAVNGRVPRNEFGNVYMFQECMLPVGCVHLHLPNLQRVARKLNVDCGSAVTGFDHHGGYSHAVTDGYIVCKEHEEILRDAWVNEQEILKKKEQEKREKRAVANWTLLVKGLLIKQRLQRRYGQQGRDKDTGIAKSVEEKADGSSSEEEGEGGTVTAPPSLAVSWPQNRQEEQEEAGSKKSLSKRERRGRQKHLFPFEKNV